MSHMVIYRGSDGRPGYHQTEELDDAVHFVESLRNSEGVEHARIFRMDEVGFEFRPYFRVEIAGGAPAPAEAAPTPASEPVFAAEAVAPAPETPATEPAAAEWPTVEAWVPADASAEMTPAMTAAADAGGNGSAAVGRRGLFGR